jgi:hypothetical protein
MCVVGVWSTPPDIINNRTLFSQTKKLPHNTPHPTHPTTLSLSLAPHTHRQNVFPSPWQQNTLPIRCKIQEYINHFLYFYNKRDSISDSELYELTKMLVVKQYSYGPNIPHFEAKLTGNMVLGFTEIECVTYRFHPLDNQVVGHNTYFTYINLNKNKWLYNFRVPADEKELIEQIKRNITRCSSADKKVWLELVPR